MSLANLQYKKLRSTAIFLIILVHTHSCGPGIHIKCVEVLQRCSSCAEPTIFVSLPVGNYVSRDLNFKYVCRLREEIQLNK
jgi:hypothetical protein